MRNALILAFVSMLFGTMLLVAQTPAAPSDTKVADATLAACKVLTCFTLPAPAKTGGMTLNEALATRRSVREYASTKLTQQELNFAVQKTIDRIIFLRICEDRGIETYGSLQALVNGERTYKRLCDLFYRADEKYNSGLFHFSREKDRPGFSPRRGFAGPSGLR